VALHDLGKQGRIQPALQPALQMRPWLGAPLPFVDARVLAHEGEQRHVGQAGFVAKKMAAGHHLLIELR